LNQILKDRHGLTASQWYHVTVTYDSNGLNGNLKMYINGEFFKSNQVSGNITDPTSSLSIGSNGSNDIIDEVRVYNRALSDAEIAAIYNATK